MPKCFFYPFFYFLAVVFAAFVRLSAGFYLRVDRLWCKLHGQSDVDIRMEDEQQVPASVPPSQIAAEMGRQRAEIGHYGGVRL